jgi:hypothetical protein
MDFSLIDYLDEGTCSTKQGYRTKFASCFSTRSYNLVYEVTLFLSP